MVQINTTPQRSAWREEYLKLYAQWLQKKHMSDDTVRRMFTLERLLGL